MAMRYDPKRFLCALAAVPLLAALLPVPAALGQSQPAAGVDLRGSWRWTCCRGQYSGTFQITTQSPDGAFSGRFGDTPADGKSPLSGRLTAAGIEFNRTILPVNQNQLWKAQLSGTSSALKMIDGNWSGYGFVAGSSGDFHAEKIAAAPPPPPPPPAKPQGVRYRVENFVYGAPDMYLNPRNYHDFLVDFATCSIREMNQPSDQGLEQVHVSVCRNKTRLQFTTATPNSTPVEYDWVFLDGGKTISGAYRAGSSFGPSVGGIYNSQ
jgi:hypothetical protein